MAMSKFRTILFLSFPSSPSIPCLCLLFSSSAPIPSRHPAARLPFLRPRYPKNRISSKPPKKVHLHKPKNLIDAALAILKQPTEGWRIDSRWEQLYTLFLPYGGGITPKQVSKILKANLNKPIRAKKFFDWATRSKLLANRCHTLASYACIVHVLARCRFQRLARSILVDVLGHIQPADAPKSMMLKPVAILHSLLDTYDDFNSAPFVFDLLIEACLKMPRVDQIVLPMLPIILSRSKYYLRLVTCNLLIKAVVDQSGCREAYPMYRKIFGLDDGKKVMEKIGISPDVGTYNELLRGFYEGKEIGKFEELWGELKGRFTPNNYSYKIALAAFCDAEKMMEAEDMLIEMRGMPFIGLDLVVYNTLIGGFCRVGDVTRAKYLFKEMKENAIEANYVTYQNLIYGYWKMGDIDSAMKHFKGMIKDGFMPRPSTVEGMIRALCGNKRVSDACHVFRVAMSNPFYVPSSKISTVLIKGYIENGEVGEALKLREDMVAKGFYPCSESYKALINEYNQKGNNEVVKMLKKENTQRRPAKKQQEIRPMLLNSFFEGETSLFDKTVWPTTNKL